MSNFNLPTHLQGREMRQQEGVLRGVSAYVKSAPPPPVISPGGKNLYNRKQAERENLQYGKPTLQWTAPPQIPSETETYFAPSPDRNRSRTNASSSGLPKESTSRDSMAHSVNNHQDNLFEHESEIFPKPQEINEWSQLLEQQQNERHKMDQRLYDELLIALTKTAEKILHLETAKSTAEDLNVDLRMSINRSEDEIKSLKEQVEALRSEIYEAKSRIKQKEAAESEMQAKLHSQGGELTHLINRNSDLKEEIRNLNLVLKNLEAAHEKEHREQSSQLATLKTTNENLVKQFKHSEMLLQQEKVQVKASKEKLSESSLALSRETSEKLKFKADSEKLQKEIATLNITLSAQKWDADLQRDKRTRVEKELVVLANSLTEETEKRKASDANCDTLTQEKSQLNDTVTLQRDEMEKLKQEVSMLRTENQNLQAKLVQSQSAIDNVMEGFMEKIEQQQSSSRNDIKNWCVATKKDLHLDGATPSTSSSHETCQPPVTRKAAGSKKRNAKKEVGDQKLLHLLRTVYATISKRKVSTRGKKIPKKPFANSSGDEKTHASSEAALTGNGSENNMSPELTKGEEEAPVITSSTVSSNCVQDATNEMDVDVIMTVSPEISIANSKSTAAYKSGSQIDFHSVVSDKTVSSSDKPKPTSPILTEGVTKTPQKEISNSKSFPPVCIPVRISPSIPFSPQQPLTPSTSTSRQQPIHRYRAPPPPTQNSPAEMCPWCENIFPSLMAKAKHVCEKPQDPRLVKQTQRK